LHLIINGVIKLLIMKAKIYYFLFLLSIIGLVGLCSSCDPCRNIAKYERCFPADTVKQIEYKTKYIKEFVTNDSIVYQTEPCDPKDSLVYRTKTEYRTKTIIKCF